MNSRSIIANIIIIKINKKNSENSFCTEILSVSKEISVTAPSMIKTHKSINIPTALDVDSNANVKFLKCPLLFKKQIKQRTNS